MSNSIVKGKEKGFYGKSYWFAHQEKDLHYPNILVRAQEDLAGRCAHWLNILIHYKPPPGKILEVGCAHGGFVALLRWAGFEATGLELSPWVARNAQETFGVPVFQGQVEDQNIESDSLDVIVMMDVLEHLPNIQKTLRHCLKILKKDGIFFIQTPRYPEGSSFGELASQKDPFIEQLKGNEHLFLFSKNSIRELFLRLGCEFVTFMPAVFSHYDMSLIAGRKPIKKRSDNHIKKTFLKSPNGRFIQAFLRLKRDNQILRNEFDQSDSDREARSTQINKLTGLLKESETDREARSSQINKLTGLLKESETDREARSTQINKLTGLLKESETDREARMAQIHELTRLLKACEFDRAESLWRINVLETKVSELKERLNTFERTRLVRIARSMGLIKVRRMDPTDEEGNGFDKNTRGR